MLRRMVIALAVALNVVGFAETAIFAVVSNELHRSASFVGVIMSAQGVGAIIGGPLSAPLMRRLGERWLSGAGLILVVVGSVLFEGGSLTLVLLGAVVFGVALPLSWSACSLSCNFEHPTNCKGERSRRSISLRRYLRRFRLRSVPLIPVLGYRGELSIIAVVVALSAIILLLPLKGEPNFGPTVEAAPLDAVVDSP